MSYPKEHDLRTSTIIVEPVGAGCNLSCKYCYHSNIRKEKLEVMSEYVLRTLIRESLKINNKRIKFLWHGGEPLLAGLNFYQTAIKIQNQYRLSKNQQIANHLQTNAILIDKEWAGFFRDNSFKISTSIDGPAWLHDKCRCFQNGKGSFHKTIKGIETLKQFGLNVGVVVTINRYNVKYPDLIYQTLLDLDIKNFEFNIASDVPGISSLAPSSFEASKLLKRVFNLWFCTDDPSVYIRIFHNVIRSLVGAQTKDCSFAYNRCREYIASDEKGAIYTCGRFLKEEEAYLGSCLNKSLVGILNAEKTKQIYDQVSRVKEECLECQWLGACGGGCAYQRWFNGGFGSHFPQCEIRKSLFQHIEKKTKKHI